MPTRDPYKVLGVSREASGDDVRKAYRRLVRQHHPDTNPDAPEAEERFKEIQQAYEVLSNPEKRRRHDERYRASSRKSHGGSRTGTVGSSRNTSTKVDLADLLAKLGDRSGDRAGWRKEFGGHLDGKDLTRIAKLFGVSLEGLSGLLGEVAGIRAHVTFERGGPGQGSPGGKYKKPPIPPKPPIPRKPPKPPRPG